MTTYLIKGKQEPVNIIHYELSAMRNKTFIILYFSGQDIEYALQTAKSSFEDSLINNCLISTHTTTIFSKEFRVDENMLHNEQYENYAENYFLDLMFKQTEERNLEAVNVSSLLDADFRITVAVKQSKIKPDMFLTLKQSIMQLLAADMRYFEANLGEPNLEEFMDSRLESYDDILNEDFYCRSYKLDADNYIASPFFSYSSKEMFLQSLNWDAQEKVDFPFDIAEKGERQQESDSPKFSSISEEYLEKQIFEEQKESFIYRYKGKQEEVIKSMWGGLQDWSLISLTDAAVQCKFCRIKSSGGATWEKYKKEELMQALSLVSKENWSLFIQKCILTLEREEIKNKLVIAGPSAIANSIAYSISMILPVFTHKYISYEPLEPYLPQCLESCSNRSSISGVSDFLQSQQFKCSHCGRYCHQIRPLSSFLQVIQSPIQYIDKEILFDILTEGWAVADLCSQKVYYLPKRYEKRYYMKYIREIDMGLQNRKILPARGDYQEFFEQRRCLQLTRQEELKAPEISKKNYVYHIRSRKNGMWFKFV